MALTVLPFFQMFDNSGKVLAGASLYCYQAGTSTPQTVWTDSAGTIAFPNPIVLDSAGRPSGPIYLSLSPAYKFIVKDVNGVQVGPTYDNYVAYSPGSL